MNANFGEIYTEIDQVFAGGAMAFSSEVVKLMFEHHGRQPLAEGGSHKGSIIFTGTMGALRTNPQFASYGGSRAAVRSLAQAVAKEYSPVSDFSGVSYLLDLHFRIVSRHQKLPNMYFAGHFFSHLWGLIASDRQSVLPKR